VQAGQAVLEVKEDLVGLTVRVALAMVPMVPRALTAGRRVALAVRGAGQARLGGP